MGSCLSPTKSANEGDTAMPTVDDAEATPMTLLRPSSFGPNAPRPRAALVVRLPGSQKVREAVLQGLLGRGWQLVPPPAGEFEPDDDAPRANVRLTPSGSIQVDAGRETVFNGPLALHPGPDGSLWSELARGFGEVLVLLTVGTTSVLTGDDADRAARAGRLVGIAGTLIDHDTPTDPTREPKQR